MGFRSCMVPKVLANVLLFGALGWGQEGASIRVLVIDRVEVTPVVLKRAETEAARLFADVGINVDWVNCTPTDASPRMLRPNEFVLQIVPDGTTRTNSVFGEAFLGEDGHGKYGDVYFDRIRSTQEDVDIASMLGAVSAHELGHLLLGTHAHSPMGIMEPVWRTDSVRKIKMGALAFTRKEGELMRKRIAKEDVVDRVSSVSLRSRIEY